MMTGLARDRAIAVAWLAVLALSIVISLSYPNRSPGRVVLPRAGQAADHAAWPPTRAMLNGIADDRGRIVVVGVNSGYIDMFYGWARSATDAGLTNILIMALDDDAYAVLKAEFPDRTLLSSTNVDGGTAEFGSVKFNRLTRTRPSFIRAVLDLDYAVFYTDIDTIVRRNPLHEIDRALERNPDTNLIVAEDGFQGYYCSCMLYFTCDQQSRDLLKAWENVCADQTDHDDQYALNAVISEHLIQGRLHMVVIPESVFPSGKRMFHQGYDWNRHPDGPSIVHANYMVGHDQKMRALQNRAAWYWPNYPLALYDETVLIKWK